MQLKQISYFLRTCDTLNFTRAAALCNVTQPSLSAAINKLEDELGGKLFERNERTIELTSFGHAMRVQLGRIEEAQIAAIKTASELTREENTTVNVGLMCTLSPQILLTALSDYGVNSGTNDDLLIHDISAANWQEVLLSGAVDCVLIAHTAPITDRFEVNFLNTEQMVLGVPHEHPLSEISKVQLKQIQEYNYVDRLNCEFREMFFKEMSDRKYSVNVVLRSEREDLVQQSISTGVGVSILPKSTAIDLGLTYCEVADICVKRSISVVANKASQAAPAVQRLVDAVRNAHAS